MKIIITGVGGFIGSYLADELSKQNEVIGLYHNNLSPGFKRDYDLRKIDITKKSELRNLHDLKGADMIIHLAATTNMLAFDANPSIWKSDVLGTKNLIELSYRMNIHKFMFFSSAAVFRSKGLIRMGSKQYSSSAYSMAKIAMHRMLKESSLDYAIVFPTFPYGPGQKKYNLISKLIDSVTDHKTVYLNKGCRPIIEPIFISDLVNGVTKLIKKDFDGKYYFFAGPDRVSIRDLIGIIGRKTGIAAIVEEKETDSFNYIVDTRRTEKILHFKPSVGLDRGISLMLKERSKKKRPR